MAYQSSISKTILPNGVRILSERVPYVDSVSIGVWALAGARDENETRHGMSHFIEHMLFKGTEKRSARQIADEMDSLGGHLNAFTDKEFTCYYSKVLKEHLEQAMDIVSDMVLHSAYETAEIDREKCVILEEIKRHQDTPEDEVHDILTQTLWKGHHLGNSVIGSEDVVRSLNRESLMAYVDEHYRPDGLLISAAGNVEHARFVEIVRAHFGSLSGKRVPRDLTAVTPHADMRIIDKQTEQVHFCLGTVGFAQHDKEKYTLAAIDSILGGGMSSRLFQEIRESRGLAYSIGSYSAAYQEAGLFAIYGGTGVENIREVVELTRRECETIGRESVTEAELERAKNQIRGALVLGQESMSNRMSRLARSELYFGRNIRTQEVISSIMNVTRDEIADVAGRIFGEAKFAVAAIGPFTQRADILDGVFN